MKPIAVLMAAAALTTTASVHAQSSVTLYGLLDIGVNYVSNAQTASPGSPFGHSGARQFAMSSGVLQASRWGLKGTEDLGGGYKAIFTLENGFDVGTGRFQQGGTFWGRQAFVGIATPWGRVTMGRQYDSIVDVVNIMQAGVGGGAFADHPGDIDNFANSQRVNNSVKFTSTTYHGLYVTGLYSFGGVPGTFGKNSIYSFGASYSGGPVTLGAGYLHVNNPNQSWFGNNSTGSPTANNISAVTGVQINPIYGGFASARTYQVVGFAGQYDFGPVQVGVNYSNIGFQNLNYSGSGTLSLTNPLGYTGTASFNNYSVFTRYFVTPTVQVSGSYDFLYGGKVGGKPGARYHTVNLGADYFLSKRTDIYLLGAFMKASGTDSTGQSAVPFFVTATPSNKSSQLIIRLGMRTRF